MQSFLARMLDVIFPESARVRRVRTDSDALPLAPVLRMVGGRAITMLAPYNDKRIEDAICSVKFERSRSGAIHLAQMLDDYLTEHLAEKKLFGEAPAYIVPIPLGAKRKLSRGENQVVMVLNESKAVQSGEIRLLECLVRVRETKPQSTLARDARLENVRGAFGTAHTQEKSIRGTRVLLIDDVTTTGATLSVAAKVLEKAGARVECLALAG